MNMTYGDTPEDSHLSNRLKDQPAGERPRERLIEHGAIALSAAELIAILVRTGLRGTNALDIGRQLVQKFGSLGAMARASVDDLQCIRGIGPDKAVTLVAAFTLGSKIAEELHRESPMRPRTTADPSVVINNFVQAMAYVWGVDGTQGTPLFARLAKEVLWPVYEKKMTLNEVK